MANDNWQVTFYILTVKAGSCSCSCAMIISEPSSLLEMIYCYRAVSSHLTFLLSSTFYLSRSALSVWLFNFLLKIWLLFASLTSFGNSFHGFTTLWLKKCPLSSVLILFPCRRVLSSEALVVLPPVSDDSRNRVSLSALLGSVTRSRSQYWNWFLFWLLMIGPRQCFASESIFDDLLDP